MVFYVAVGCDGFVSYDAVGYYTVSNFMICFDVVRYGKVLVLYGLIWYGMMWCGAIWFDFVLYGFVLFGMVWDDMSVCIKLYTICYGI